MPTLPKKEVHVSRRAISARAVRHADPEALSASRDKRKRLGDLLLDEDTITPEQLQQAIEYQREHGGFLGRALVQLELISQDDLVNFLVKQCNIPHLNLTDYQIQREVMALLPLTFCRERQVIPIDRLGSMLTLAMVNPFDLDTLEDIRTKFPTLRIKPMLCNWQHLEKVLDRHEARSAPFVDGLGLESMASPDGAALANVPEQPLVQADPDMLASFDAGAAAPKPERLQETQEAHDDQPPEPAVLSAVAELVKAAAQPEAPHPETGTRKATSLSTTIREVFEDNDGAAWIDAFFGDDDVEQAADVPGAPDDLDMDVEQQPAEPVDAATPSPEDDPAQVNGTASVAGAWSLASVVRDSIREAVGQVAEAIRERGENDMPPSAQELSGSLRGAVFSAIKGLEQRVSSEEALNAVGDDLPEIHAATQQALREAETLVVTEARLQELEAAHRRKQIPFTLPRYHSVHSFGNPEQGCLPKEHDEIVLTALESERPLQEYRFDDFFVDKTNAFTFSLCRAVAEKPGQDYNPFFLYGNVGVGKTHLVNAIGNFIQSRDDVSRVGYVSAIFFASRLSDAIKDGALKTFRDNYCHWDVLILDDMQFLAGRIEAQEEFFHIFNALYQAGRQIIIAGDQAPDRLGLLEERLVSRFSGGIVAQLRPPNYETRLAILRHHVRLRGTHVPEDVIAFLSQHITHDVRKLTGSLRKVLAFAELVGQDITLDMAKDNLGHLGVAEAV
jgi:chromosomal replication initiator protein DnaA